MARSWGDLLGEDGSGETDEQQAGFFGRLRDSLSKSRRALTQQFAAFDPNDEAAWERLEEALIAADVGVRSTAELVRKLEEQGGLGGFEDELAAMLGEPGTLNIGASPAVILVVGVNGTGKTTTIGKLAAKLREHGRSVLLGRGRHVPRRGRGAAGDLGGAGGRRLRRRAARRRPGGGRVRRDRGARARAAATS